MVCGCTRWLQVSCVWIVYGLSVCARVVHGVQSCDAVSHMLAVGHASGHDVSTVTWRHGHTASIGTCE